ncbi:MAG: molybdopterin molybdotransferase MoeA [Anaerolineales bacterium]|nr:molybdopterin molybdotransferase MoeA [Anaerolineales bacterium]
MLSVSEALQRILEHIDTLEAESVALEDAFERVLSEDVVASYPLPPFANSSMDGYAVQCADLEPIPVRLQVVQDIPAGHAPEQVLERGQAARIMTGAPLPTGADTVVPVEFTNDVLRGPTPPAEVTIMQTVSCGENVRHSGEDVQQGEVVLPQGRQLRAADLGMLAGLGYTAVSVIRQPRIALISTGDELLTSDQPLRPGKIHDTNSYTLSALIRSWGGVPVRLGIARDTVGEVRSLFQRAIDLKSDLILSTAGVSVGAFDVVKTVLDELGAVDFWRVNMRPGKPLTFGQMGGIPFVGLPGNPVSAMVTFMVFVRPVIATMLGLDPAVTDTQTVRVGEAMSSDGRMTFVRIRLVEEGGEWVAYTTGTQSSGALSSLVKADGLLIIPADKRQVKAGEYLEVWRLNR